jgi:hypothetical protein
LFKITAKPALVKDDTVASRIYNDESPISYGLAARTLGST